MIDIYKVTWDSAKINHSATVFSNNDLTAYIKHSDQTVVTNYPKSSGKWYFELKMGSILNAMVGIVSVKSGYGSTHNSTLSRYYAINGSKIEGNTSQSYGLAYSNNDTIGIALNLDDGTIEFYKNGVSQGIAFRNLSELGEVYPAFTTNGTSSSITVTAIFEEQLFNYPIPNGYKPYGLLPYSKILLKSNNKIYSIESNNSLYKTYMTSDTVPAPLRSSASSVYINASSYQAWRAFSESTNNWMADNVPQWVQLDFGSKNIFNRVRIKSSNEANQSPKRFQVLGSNDGSNYHVIQEFSVNTWEANTWKEFYFKKSDYTVYRINVLEVYSPNTYNRVSINQIIFGLDNNVLIELPTLDIEYGQQSLLELNKTMINKNYILQVEVSEISDNT
ncbi:hypothetical protein B1B04_24930 [Lysinibacillus sp. KCTC 33748]|uniref:SPRY domain-containing protein n=1 Tax=unclassified Lysinibacillus TaxID=2636778 RepID=UPI0009A65B89|nr:MULTISPECIES: SPRY domain-containing protein [unclassified Lysinibacillus]OXS65598.1 hypothetical protein B1B04_24930 [Lysinibacillus sp. KCTC 33748]SKC19502.1 F5/8 type C domain-containing protein [Lysinibacillus sp. AC-3]